MRYLKSLVFSVLCLGSFHAWGASAVATPSDGDATITLSGAHSGYHTVVVNWSSTKWGGQGYLALDFGEGSNVSWQLSNILATSNKELDSSIWYRVNIDDQYYLEPFQVSESTGEPKLFVKVTLKANPTGRGEDEVRLQDYDQIRVGYYGSSRSSGTNWVADGSKPARKSMEFDETVEFSRLQTQHIGGGVYEQVRMDSGTLSFGAFGTDLGAQNSLYEFAEMGSDNANCPATESASATFFDWNTYAGNSTCHVVVEIRAVTPDYLR